MPAHATEMPPEALKPYPVWERDAKLKLDHLASERIPRGIQWETLTRSGFPAAEITAAAKDSNVDLIVMATRGRNRSALGNLFLKRDRASGTNLGLRSARASSCLVSDRNSNVDLIVMATRGRNRSALGHLFLKRDRASGTTLGLRSARASSCLV